MLGYHSAGVEAYDYMALRGPVGVLHDTVVDPAWRGHGAGRMLLDVTLPALEVRGVIRAVLVTAERLGILGGGEPHLALSDVGGPPGPARVTWGM